MKRLLAGIALCLLAHGAWAQGSLKKLDERNGFKGFVLGDSIKNYNMANLKPLPTSGPMFYSVKEFNKKIGAAEVSSMYISVFEGKVSSISAYFEHRHAEAIRRTLEEAYGRWTERDGGRYRWMTDRVWLIFDTRPAGGDGPNMMFVSVDLLDRSSQATKRKEAEAVDDL